MQKNTSSRTIDSWQEANYAPHLKFAMQVGKPVSLRHNDQPFPEVTNARQVFYESPSMKKGFTVKV